MSSCTAMATKRCVLQSTKYFNRNGLSRVFVRHRFYNPTPEGSEYTDKVMKRISRTEYVGNKIKGAPRELRKWTNEWRNVFRMDPTCGRLHGDYEVMWRFNDKAALSEWIVSSDKDIDEGKSEGEFVLSPQGTGIFRGKISTELNKAGLAKRTGYCNIASPIKTISWERVRPYDWSHYTHLVVRTRGDGRSYNLVLSMDRYYDVQWNDQFCYILFTRGGPYWQTAKIPFSKFLLTSRGIIQDKQHAVDLDAVKRFGITLADGVSGPFQLELDYVGVICDLAHSEQFVYEMYEHDPYIY